MSEDCSGCHRLRENAALSYCVECDGLEFHAAYLRSQLKDAEEVVVMACDIESITDLEEKAVAYRAKYGGEE